MQEIWSFGKFDEFMKEQNSYQTLGKNAGYRAEAPFCILLFFFTSSFWCRGDMVWTDFKGTRFPMGKHWRLGSWATLGLGSCHRENPFCLEVKRVTKSSNIAIFVWNLASGIILGPSCIIIYTDKLRIWQNLWIVIGMSLINPRLEWRSVAWVSLSLDDKIQMRTSSPERGHAAHWWFYLLEQPI